MSKLERIKTMLSELLELEMSSSTSDKGVVYWNEDELKVGTSIYVQDENDIKVLAEDGDYEIEDKIYKVEGGIVTEITDKTMPVEIVETPEEEELPEPEEKPEEEEEKPEDKPETDEDETPELEEEVENPDNEGEEDDTEAIVKLREEVNELYKVVDILKKELEELKGKPVAMSAMEELENIKKANSNLKGIERYAEAIKAMRK